jgi:hypothetical protein
MRGVWLASSILSSIEDVPSDAGSQISDSENDDEIGTETWSIEDHAARNREYLQARLPSWTLSNYTEISADDRSLNCLNLSKLHVY